jgi:hypothetical protein
MFPCIILCHMIIKFQARKQNQKYVVHYHITENISSHIICGKQRLQMLVIWFEPEAI